MATGCSSELPGLAENWEGRGDGVYTSAPKASTGKLSTELRRGGVDLSLEYRQQTGVAVCIRTENVRNPVDV